MADTKSNLDWNVIKSFSKQVSIDIGAAMLGAMSYIGDRLGIFKALADAGAVTVRRARVAPRLDERYLREWLGCDDRGRIHRATIRPVGAMLPPEHAMVLAREDSPFFMRRHLSEMVIPNLSVAPKVDGGVPQPAAASRRASIRPRPSRRWSDRRPRCIGTSLFASGCRRCRRSVAKLEQRRVRRLDVGCGSGRAAIAMAQAFPGREDFGFDAHPGSLERARANARAAGLADRITFEVARLQPSFRRVTFDFISTFDVVHDSVDPVGVAAIDSRRAEARRHLPDARSQRLFPGRG